LAQRNRLVDGVRKVYQSALSAARIPCDIFDDFFSSDGRNFESLTVRVLPRPHGASSNMETSRRLVLTNLDPPPTGKHAQMEASPQG
jgi:hypothetical protein